jgi:hypothetical protein
MNDCKNPQHRPRIINWARSEFPRMAQKLLRMLNVRLEINDQTP